ncbi:Zinc finger protein [Plakobranchus ocellatus]|uniref:Zinc finger protein n=1 Tax=Plakobranchus ocellatus TaxID=259542 RepID=A0AAV4BFC4_9GAST|nr:Zinc finger protein [Plakobranchus ocellatus]
MLQERNMAICDAKVLPFLPKAKALVFTLEGGIQFWCGSDDSMDTQRKSLHDRFDDWEPDVPEKLEQETGKMLDTNSRYWQIPVRLQHIPKTAFMTMDRKESLRMPFAMNSGATVTRAMEGTLHGRVRIRPIGQHSVRTLMELFRRLQWVNFTVRLTKFVHGGRKIDFLGHREKEQSVSRTRT